MKFHTYTLGSKRKKRERLKYKERPARRSRPFATQSKNKTVSPT